MRHVAGGATRAARLNQTSSWTILRDEQQLASVAAIRQRRRLST